MVSALSACLITANTVNEAIDRSMVGAEASTTPRLWPQTVIVEDVPGEPYFGKPFAGVPIGATDGSRYAGEVLGVAVHQTWPSAVFAARDVSRKAVDRETLAHQPLWTSSEGPTAAAQSAMDTYQQAEGTYVLDSQLHGPVEPFWVSVHPTQKGISVTLPTRWPGLVRRTVARVLGIQPARVTVHAVSPSIDRDASVLIPAQLGAWAAVAAHLFAEEVFLRLTPEMMVLTGGRAGARVLWSASIDEDGALVRNNVDVNLNAGAYPLIPEETLERLRLQATDLYRTQSHSLSITVESSTAPPLGLFEGLHASQVAFAREMHMSRLAELAQQDPAHYRLAQLRDDMAAVAEVCRHAVRQSDFHRRFSANELQKKRRTAFDPLGKRTRGIGVAMATQRSGFVGTEEIGAVTVRLEREGKAVISCSLPTANPRLETAWRTIVAEQLGIDPENVTLNSEYGGDATDSGPAFLSRGVAAVPRAIESACAAIQKQRFRKALPLQVRRAVRRRPRGHSLPDSGIAAGAAVVEVEVDPPTMEIEVRSVTLAVMPGRVLDRLALEAEMRRGIYQALGWTLHEGLSDPNAVTTVVLNGQHSTAYRGKRPRIRVTIVPAGTKDGPAGVGELPFSTVPAATLSALSQATGLYLDRISATPTEILKILEQQQ